MEYGKAIFYFLHIEGKSNYTYTFFLQKKKGFSGNNQNMGK